MPEFLSIALYEFKNNYFNFKGRATRSQFWYFVLSLFLVNIVVQIFGMIPYLGTLITFAWALFTLIPSIAIQVRRLHDTNKSGLLIIVPYACIVLGLISLGLAFACRSSAFVTIMQILMLLALLSYIGLIVLWCLKSDEGENKYGPVATIGHFEMPKKA